MHPSTAAATLPNRLRPLPMPAPILQTLRPGLALLLLLCLLLRPAMAATVGELLGSTPRGSNLLGTPAGTVGPALPAEQAFRVEALADRPDRLLLRFDIAPGYYVYRDMIRVRAISPQGTRLSFGTRPAARTVTDPYFGTQAVYFGEVVLPVNVQGHSPGGGRLNLRVDFMACQERGICYPPLHRLITVHLPAASGAAAARPTPERPAAASAASRPQPAAPGRVIIPSQPWSPQRLAALRAQGRVVFVNITADWCVTCKANERGVLASAGFEAALRQAAAVYLKGDWTETDPAITAYLQTHGVQGVPFYAIYPADGGPAELLPARPSVGLLEAALRRAAGSTTAIRTTR